MNVAPAGVSAKIASTAMTLGRYAWMLASADASALEAKGMWRPGRDALSRIRASLVASATMMDTSDGIGGCLFEFVDGAASRCRGAGTELPERCQPSNAGTN